MRITAAWFFIVVSILCSCGEKETTLFTRLQNTGIDFTNSIQNNKDFNIFTYRNFYNGGGAAIGDINNDGLADVFFTANMGDNKLYLNKGNMQFEDVTDKAGIKNNGKWGTGIVFVDVNGDSWLDLYVCYAGYQKGVGNQNELYINNRDLTFTEAAAKYNLDDSGYTTHASFFDYDLDGDLDCYLLKNSFIPVNTLNFANKRELRAEDWPVADFLKGGGDKLLRNDNGVYTDVSKEANIYGSLIGFGLGVTVGDVNHDRYPDLYISNDFFERDYLYVNQKNGTFKEDLENWTQHISHSSMGADIADVNNDGYPDIFTTDMLPDDDHRLKSTTSFENYDVNALKVRNGFYYQYMQNTLQVNNRNGKFMETAFYSGVAASDWSWGGLIFDADNDGHSDLFVCNGINNDVTDQDFIEFFANDVIQKMVMTGEKNQIDEIIGRMPSRPIPNKAYRNMGDLRFSDQGKEWGLDEPSFSNGAAYGDLDNDGDLDLIINNVNQPAWIYRNNSRQQSKEGYIGIALKGKSPNTFGIGSTIKVYQNNQVLTREVIPSRGFQSSVDYKVIIGLGEKPVDSLTITWPDRSISIVKNPEVNKTHTISQNSAVHDTVHVNQPETAVMLRGGDSSVFEKHQEDNYVDFYYERGVPVMLSREGPKAAQADVNGDGLADVYVCGGPGQSGQLYLQTAAGFRKKQVSAFHEHKEKEEVAALFFDADSDGDADLFVGCGGNNGASGEALRNRLYLNDGKGNFSSSPNQLPGTGMNTSGAVAHDFDEDGDLDLFVASRSVPLNYGVTPVNAFYLNDGSGKFINTIATTHKNIARLGMITGVEIADVDGDNRKELIVVGEWMAPRVFKFASNQFTEIKTGLENLDGWWRCVKAADLDGDGDQDLVLGNIGENFYLRPDSLRPVKMFINDFEKKGTIDKVITQTINGKDKPVFMKKELTEQLATLRKQNLKYADYANKSIGELFKEEDIKGSLLKEFDYPSSCIALNDGKGGFTIKKLPLNVQLSSVNAINVSDLNADGLPDLVMGGNEFNLLPQFCRLDASFGHVLINRGKGDFEWIYPDRSGLEVRGQVRDIIEVATETGNRIIVLQNNEAPRIFSVSRKQQ